MDYQKSRLPGPATWSVLQELEFEDQRTTQDAELAATTLRVSFTDDTIRAKLDDTTEPRRVLVMAFDVTELSQSQITALAAELISQCEASTEHPEVSVAIVWPE